MVVFKKRLPVRAVQLRGNGSIETDRGELLGFVAGDWLLTSQDGQQWPVSDAYFKANYEKSGGCAVDCNCPDCGSSLIDFQGGD